MLILTGFVLPGSAWAQKSTLLEIGVLPNISARVLMMQYQPMRDYLERSTGRPVHISTAPNWNAFHSRTLNFEYDVVVTAAHLARVAQIDRGFIPLVSYAPEIKGMIAYAQDRPLPSIAALKGQTLALSNPQSLVTLRGMAWLAEHGLQRGRDFKTINTPTDDSVGAVVDRGDAIAAMLSAGEYRATPEAIKSRIKIWATFAEVPGFVVLASPRLTNAQAQAIKHDLLRFAANSDEGRLFFNSTGFNAMREVAPGLMKSMDPYVDATRAALTPSQ